MLVSEMLHDFAETCYGGKFVVPRAGEVYDARGRVPNRKFRVNGWQC